MLEPIAKSVLDNDAYVDSMAVLAQKWPDARVRYEYINRDPNHTFSPRFEKALRDQVESLAQLRMTDEEFEWSCEALWWLPRPYLEWRFNHFRYEPKYIDIKMNDGRLGLTIEGPWYKCLYFETPVLYTISRLNYTTLLNNEPVEPRADWKDWLRASFDQMAAARVNWIDFGARRRFSYEIEDFVVELGKDYAPFFRGTANPHLAMKHGVKTYGTYAHQYVQAMMALYGPLMCNRMAMEHWSQQYRGNLGVALTDTLTTDHFLRDFDTYYAKLFDGVRQDSGNPQEMIEKYIKHYEKLGIDPASKLVVASDGLTPGKASTLAVQFADRIKLTCGIGTSLTHSVGHPPMNHVIKATAFDFGHGFVPVVKLSDVDGKVSGDPQMVATVKQMIQMQG